MWLVLKLASVVAEVVVLVLLVVSVVVLVVPDAVQLATLRQNVVLPAAGSPQQDTSTHGMT